LVSALKTAECPTLSSHRGITLIVNAGQLFEEVLFTGVFWHINVGDLMYDEPFGFDQVTAQRCIWLVLLETSTESLTRGG
jgi:hypothetical protein